MNHKKVLITQLTKIQIDLIINRIKSETMQCSIRRWTSKVSAIALVSEAVRSTLVIEVVYPRKEAGKENNEHIRTENVVGQRWRGRTYRYGERDAANEGVKVTTRVGLMRRKVVMLVHTLAATRVLWRSHLICNIVWFETQTPTHGSLHAHHPSKHAKDPALTKK